MVRRKFLIGAFLFLAFSCGRLGASNWEKVVELKGTWFFSIGDYPSWSIPATNIDGWHKVYVPNEWEKYYEGYNGFAWYRKSFEVGEISEEKDLFVFLGFIDDVDEVFLNGVKIGQSGAFPPNQQTAYNVERKYLIPKNILKPNQNTIAVRVFDEGKPGGIVGGDKIGIYYDINESILELDLSGNWKFTTEKVKDIHTYELDEGGMDEIYVPATWESQGYDGHDGYAWYRKRFSLPNNLPANDLYLVLGQIDDLDKVYINGKFIGEIKDQEAYKKVGFDRAYRLYRSYKIPEGLLQKNNVISVEVYDRSVEGGIYSDPVGIMTEANNNIFISQNPVEKGINSFWDVLKYLFNWEE